MSLRAVAFIYCTLLTLCTPAAAQEPVEIMPDHLVRRIEADQATVATDKLVGEGRVSRAIVAGAKRWNPAEPISVCFFGGSTQLRRDIVSTAAEWERATPSIRFDFGDRANPRLCGGGFSQIRVGYSQRGYWSFLGQDSIVYAPQTEQSLNLAMFDVARPSASQFRRVVLHEFGHAIAFQHEHQHPVEGCGAEFAWPRVYSYLSGPPNYWSKETIDFNLRGLPYHNGDVATAFDRESIMLYGFPEDFYVRGRQSRCYTDGNYNLSNGDLEAAKLVYAGAPQNLAAAAIQQAALMAPALTSEVKSALGSRLALFSSDKAGQARIIGAIDAKAVDIDVFTCALNDANRAWAEELTSKLRAQPNIGRLRYRDLAYPGTERGSTSVTFVADTAHPEMTDAVRLAAAVNSPDAPSTVVPNLGGQTPWLVSVVACK